MIKRAILPTLILLVLPASGWMQRRPPSGGTPTNVAECDISGQVTMPDATSKRGLEVVLETGDHVRFRSTLTDRDGRFQFQSISLSTYYLYMNIEGFMPIEQPVVFQQSGTTATAVAVLELKRGLADPGAKSAEGTPDALKTDNSATTLSANLFAKYPQKAVKEYQQGLDEQSRGGNVDKALAHFEKATADAPQFYEAWLEVGRARQRLGRFDPAEQAFQHARTLQPQSAQPLIDLGELSLDRARKLETESKGPEAMSVYKASLALLEQASSLDPSSQQAAYFKGSAQFKVGDLAGAEASLNAALQGPRPYQDARLILVNVLMKGRRYREALEQLNAYLEANPNSPQRPAIEKMQAQIRSLP